MSKKRKKVNNKNKVSNKNMTIMEKKISSKVSLKEIFKFYVITRIVLVILMILSEVFLSTGINADYQHVFDLFDNEHYLNIAKYGYRYEQELAFFPLIPILIKCFGRVGFLVVNQILVFLTGFILYLISDKILGLDKKNVYYASIMYFVSPISIFTCMFYSEGLFLFLTVLAFYLYKVKNNYFSLGICLGLSVLTRSLGSMLFFSIFIFMAIDFFKKKEKFKNIIMTYIPATIISCLYPIYLYTKTGDLFYFINVQYIHWGRISTNIFTIFFDSFKLIFDGSGLSIFVFDFLITWGLIFFMIFYIYRHRMDKQNYIMYVYTILSIISICSTIRGNHAALASFYRYIFGCFPIYFMFRKNRLSLVLMIVLSCFISTMFLVGYYFF